ncbi:MAG TPA: hypothetical protein VLD85_14085 [Anaeromyxobacteraceae bacterium]|nr:hypothetical protein [Anaeromyxobacteraceae bacterium]
MRMLVAVAVALVPLAPALAEPGSVDWQRKVVRCSGSGAPNLRDAQSNVAVARIGAERAAKLDAIRNCLEALKGVRISGAATVGGAMAGDPALRSRVEGVVKGFKVVDRPRYFSDGGVEMDVEVPLEGVAEAVLPPAPDAGARPPPAAGGATGLLVDARGKGVVPGLAPRVLDESGQEVYSAGTVAPEARKSRGPVAYARDPDAARRDLAERIGDRPMVVRALRADGADVVIADADADALRKAPPAFLSEGRVVIVTDGEGASR